MQQVILTCRFLIGIEYSCKGESQTPYMIEAMGPNNPWVGLLVKYEGTMGFVCLEILENHLIKVYSGLLNQTMHLEPSPENLKFLLYSRKKFEGPWC